MKRTTIILSALLLILVAGYFIYLSTGSEPDNIFHIDDSSLVTEIEMEKVSRGASAEKMVLTKDETGTWMVNGEYTAIPTKVENILKTMTQIRVKGSVEKAGQESGLQLLKKSHTRVKISGADGEMKEYLIGATDSQHNANLMMVDGADKIYLVGKPGFTGYVSVFYNTNALEWRERTLFNLTPQNIKRISVAYPTTPEELGFELRRDADGDPWMLGEGVLANMDQTSNFMNLFEGKISAESFANEAFPGIRDSLPRREPDVVFEYETLSGKAGSLKLFTRPDNVNNYFGYLEGRPELYTIQRFVMDKFLKTRSFFAGEVMVKEPT